MLRLYFSHCFRKLKCCLVFLLLYSLYLGGDIIQGGKCRYKKNVSSEVTADIPEPLLLALYIKYMKVFGPSLHEVQTRIV